MVTRYTDCTFLPGRPNHGKNQKSAKVAAIPCTPAAQVGRGAASSEMEEKSSFIWQIDGFSSLLDKQEGWTNSGYFKIKDLNWWSSILCLRLSFTELSQSYIFQIRAVLELLNATPMHAYLCKHLVSSVSSLCFDLFAGTCSWTWRTGRVATKENTSLLSSCCQKLLVWNPTPLSKHHSSSWYTIKHTDDIANMNVRFKSHANLVG